MEALFPLPKSKVSSQQMFILLLRNKGRYWSRMPLISIKLPGSDTFIMEYLMRLYQVKVSPRAVPISLYLPKPTEWSKSYKCPKVATQGTSSTPLISVSYTHLRAHETRHDLVCRLLLEKKKNNKQNKQNTQNNLTNNKKKKKNKTKKKQK